MTALRYALLFAGLALLLSGCSTGRIQGVNLLQSRTVSFEDPATGQSFRKLRELGANTVAVVVFLEQDTPNSTQIRQSPAVSDAQLRAAIRSARKRRLHVFVKPQFLIPDSWAGEIAFEQEADWRRWFAAYREHLLHYARLAHEAGANGFVIGTELRRTDRRPEWNELIAALREVFPGRLSYAAHELDGLAEFAHWKLLDLAGVTLYPSLGDSSEPSALRPHIHATAQRLRELSTRLDTPVWIAEIGLQSRAGAQAQPWEWRDVDQQATAAPRLQADVIDLWLQELAGDWNQGVLLWAWSNDPRAGGPQDRDYLLQNKPAEHVLHCHWASRC